MTEQEIRHFKLNILPRKIEMRNKVIFLYALTCLSPFLVFYSIMIYQGSAKGFIQITVFSIVVSLLITALIRVKRFWKSRIYISHGEFIEGKVVGYQNAGHVWYCRFKYEYFVIVEYTYLDKRKRVLGPIITGKPKIGTAVYLLIVKENPEDVRFLLHDIFSARVVL